MNGHDPLTGRHLSPHNTSRGGTIEVLPEEHRAHVTLAQSQPARGKGKREELVVESGELKEVKRMSSERSLRRDRIRGESGAILAKVLIALLVIAVVVVGGAVVYVVRNRVEVVVTNVGCQPFRLRRALPPQAERIIDILGVELPEGLPTGGQVTLQLSTIPFDVHVDLRDKERIRVTTLGITVPVRVSGRLPSIVLNGEELSGQLTVVNLRGRQRHEVVVTCR